MAASIRPVPILTTQPAADEPVVPLRIPDQRSGESKVVGSAAPSPPEVLLPSGGSDHRGEPATGSPADPGWASAAFQRRVARVHRQLAPVVSQAALVDSYAREAARRSTRPRTVGRRSATALQVAYALRWLELGRPAVSLSWNDLLDLPPG